MGQEVINTGSRSLDNILPGKREDERRRVASWNALAEQNCSMYLVLVVLGRGLS